MSERKERSTRYLSRETVQIMLQMKSLLRKYDVEISLTAPDVYDLLIQAAEAIDDEEIDFLRLRLIAAKGIQPSSSPKAEPKTLPKVMPKAVQKARDEEDPFIDDVEEPPSVDQVSTMPAAAANHSSSQILDRPPLAAIKPDNEPVRNVYIQGPFVEEEDDVFLEGDIPEAVPTKRVALNTPRTGVLRCDSCQRVSTVVASASIDEAIEVQCACGMIYRVLLDARKFDRKVANLPGVYIDQHNEAKTGTIVVENLSFGGLRFRTTSSHTVAYDDLLYIQFALDDEAKTLIWEQVRVHYVHRDVVGVEFIDPDKFNKDLAVYLMR